MVYPASRSENKALEDGMSDGKYKKITPNRGGVVDTAMVAKVRGDLHDIWFGIHEAAIKTLPDGTVDDRSAEYVATKAPQIGV
jgi:hypothetical protein